MKKVEPHHQELAFLATFLVILSMIAIAVIIGLSTIPESDKDSFSSWICRTDAECECLNDCIDGGVHVR